MSEMTMADREEKINAVMSRDSEYDGVFVYGVKSTKIYCRPSCPSRRPNPENIVIFASSIKAEDAGYRSCLRCKPKESNRPNEAMVERITSFISGHIDEKISLSRLADEFNVSKHHLQRTFKSVLGITPRQYQEAKRLELFKSHIKNGHKVDDAMYGSGFGSRSRLYEKVPEKMGMTPTEYREGGTDVMIRFAVFDTTLTKILVARTVRGVCAVYLGEYESELTDQLHEEYPYADILQDEEALREVIEPLKMYFEGGNFNPRLPLDIHRTAFQWKVLKAIQEIPPGETRSYSELAESIGQPRAVRAVASACAKNPVAVMIPCHRVLRKNGGLGGYRWGVPLKKQLLEHEKMG
jgi:AraC family transcriptional regulator, regulatory protein of adaptative response / methylated-DNA-[protein]-cysteine methyltransferase